MKHFYCSILFLLVCFAVCAQQDSIIPFDKAYKRVYQIVKIEEGKPVVDGRLDEGVWLRSGVWSDAFVQVTPYERAQTLSSTRVKLFYDDKYIYVGVYCKDALPEKMNRFIGNRDDNNIGDLISVAFDTYHDFRAAPEFNLNIGGNKTDLIVTDKLSVNKSWNAVWEGKTHVDMADSSWTAELRIPFSQLRYNRKTEDGVWGLHVRRIIRRNNEVQNWSMIPLKNNGHVFSFGEMHGMDDLPKPRGIEFLPYVMGKYNREPQIPGSPYQADDRWKGNVGLDAKFALSDFTLDLTINPDYGQVELDPSVMNLTAYETFYEEKRPFFLEGKHILDFTNGNDMMFYTRRIGAAPSYTPFVDNRAVFAERTEHVPILGALKLTGTNRHGVTLGVVQSFTSHSTVRTTDHGQEKRVTVEPFTNYTVARLQKNWDGNTLLGGMLTSVNRFSDKPYIEKLLVNNAVTVGIDFTRFFKNRLYYVEGKGMWSHLSGTKEAIGLLQQHPVHYFQRHSSADYLHVDLNRKSLSGTGGYLKVGRKGNAKWIFSENLSWSSPGFDLNDIGYLKQTDYMANETEVAFRQTATWKRFRSNTLTLTQKNMWNYGGTPFHNEMALKWQTMTLNRYELTLQEVYCWNSLDSRLLRGGPDVRFDPFFKTSVKFNTDKARWVMWTLQYEGTHNTAGHLSMNALMPALSFRIGNHVFLSGMLNYAWNMDDMQYVPRLSYLNSRPFLIGRMDQKTYGMTLDVQVNVTPDISLQLYGAPFTSTARFSEFKRMTDASADDYANRFQMIPASEAGKWLENPDFSFNEFRSNFVARWEYMPGSTLYFVWEHRMSDRQDRYVSGWGDNLEQMFGQPAVNTFMVKLNYWFNL